PTGWEETTILAAGLNLENDDQLVRALVDVNPVLAGRCLNEGQAKVEKDIRQGAIMALLKTIARPEVALRVRIAAGEVLGYLGDSRLGELVTVPAGEFVMGEGNDQHRLMLPEYQISRYPLTRAEYERFIEAGGYQQRRWWTEAGWARKNWIEPEYWRDSRFNKPNQPVVGVSWYECVAYCRWLSAETGQPYRLPTEAEWEKAARGTDGRVYPWGNDFEASRGNMVLGEQVVNTTTPVGIYPTGISPAGLFDCSGNVWEWEQSKSADYPYQADDGRENLSGTNVRVLRGGSWGNDHELDARCAARIRLYPSDRVSGWGCRVAVSPI
ncbi:MAG: formylglycine-generating enzyme family protein, partial [Gammaproteobacteria bacterium]|nr:formylglycine-generating enzyme family protein [Gammaproteobacteria bacterium]